MDQLVFLKVSTYYGDYLNKFYEKNKNIMGLSYNDHHRLLMNDCFAWADFYQKNLTHVGCDAYKVIINDELLQKKWANEHNLNFNKKNWIRDILLLQINHYKPDVIIWGVGSFFNASLKKTIQNNSTKKILNIGFFCTLYSNLGFFKNFDVVLACSEFQYYQLKKLKIRSEILRHCFEPSILNKLCHKKRTIGVSFIGTLGSKIGVHSDRYSFIEYLLKNSDIEIWIPIPRYRSILYENFRFFYDCITSHNLKNFLLNNSIKFNAINLKKEYPTRVHDAAYGIDMFNILSQSKISINCHGNTTAVGEYAANLRLFEATGMGTLLITDWKKNLPDLFEPDKEVITYKTPYECLEKIQYYLEHEKEREAIAHAGQERTLKEHTYYHRMEELIEIIQKYQHMSTAE